MPSPFPGMDPFIEATGLTGDFHGTMMAMMRNELNARLPAGFAANIELYVWFHEPEGKRRQVAPDVYVATPERGTTRTKERRSTASPPDRITLTKVERRKQKRVEVIDVESNRVVTAIELLSPTNKTGEDRETCLAKRNDLLANGVSLVELDLLRGGRRLPLGRRRSDEADYYVMVCRSWEFPHADFWPLGLRAPLPDLPIPLTEDRGDVVLPLRKCFDQAYDGGKYRTRLKYRKPLLPKPGKADAEWVHKLLGDH